MYKNAPRYSVTNYVNGSFGIPSNYKSIIDKINPCNEEVLTNICETPAEGVAAATSAARDAFKSWRSVSRVKRGEYFRIVSSLLEEYKSEIARDICLETGKNANEALAEINESKHMCDVTAAKSMMPCGEVIASEVSDKTISVERKPRGVVACITPWNFPKAISLWTTAPAILEGNCVVHKPSELSPITADWTARLYHEAGLPAGVYNLIHGADDTGKNLVESDNVDYILFTGSAEVGRKIRQHCATTWHKGCSCEMGSKSGIIIMEDANMNIALDAAINSAFKLAGQRCVSASRILLHVSKLDEFCDKFVRATSSLKVGHPHDPDVFFGPVISGESLANVKKYNNLVRDDIACKVLLDNEHMNEKGYFISPFIYFTKWSDKSYLKEEVFGPHVAIIPFEYKEEASRIYNDTDYGLSAAVITDNFRYMKYFKENLNVGMLYFNAGTIGAESFVPFGGIRKSGYGHPSAVGNFDAVVHKISVTTNHGHSITWAQGLK